jgi:transcriptional accessory protein Tex/SPT6
MDTLLRLDSISPNLAGSFRRANDHQRRQAALATCLIAVEQSGLQGHEIDAALDLIRHGGTDQLAVRHKLESFSTQLDEDYFKINEEADATTPEALLVFRKGRAAAALAFALSPDPGQLHEAIYEAIVASDFEAEAIRAADVALRA